MHNTVILLRTSLKNKLFKQFAFETSSKPLLERFWVVLGPQIRPEGAFQGGSTNHDFRLPGPFPKALPGRVFTNF